MWPHTTVPYLETKDAEHNVHSCLVETIHLKTHCHKAALVCVTLPWFSVRSSALELKLWLPVFTASRCYIVNSPAAAAHLQALTVCFARCNLIFQCLRLLLKRVHKIGWIELFGFDLITAGDQMQSATSDKATWSIIDLYLSDKNL